MANHLHQRKVLLQAELGKCKLMWTLRFLELEIEKEKGNFRITTDGTLRIDDFSADLTQKINDEIKERLKI
jgi:hypothetical protein